MSIQASSGQKIASDRKRAKWGATICTVVYVLLFPVFFYMALFSMMVFDNPHMTTPLGLLIIFMTFWIPLSMPVSIYLMWSRYCRHQYKKAGFCCALPLITFCGVYLMLDVLPAFFR
jgi:hypothetical protein